MFAAKPLPYSQTAAFSKIVTDYLSAAGTLRPFYGSLPNLQGINERIAQRQTVTTDRQTLVAVLSEQYAGLSTTAAVQKNIESLLSPQTFTVCTAHQPNLFTGPLYFIYKILHAIKLAAYLNEALPDHHFVPVYYMGSEDADFAELAHTWVDGKKLEWKKEQRGAVGRMVVDKTLLALIDELEGQLSIEPHGAEVVALLRGAYVTGKTIQSATLQLVNELYGTLGLVVLNPDHPRLKAQMAAVFTDDLFNHQPAAIVKKTTDEISAVYAKQAHPRDINLFYLKDDIRERIEKQADHFIVLNTALSFSADELKAELLNHPECFSPNVILRGLYQETILPNLAFVGGGGELAYWMQLKNLFTHYGVPYPVLLLRNSFLVMEKKWHTLATGMGFSPAAVFKPEDELLKEIVLRNTENPVSIADGYAKSAALFAQLKAQAKEIDTTLGRHVSAMEAKTTKALQGLEKKMLRAEKRKFGSHQLQVSKLKTALFPTGNLQERVENFSRFYAKWGPAFIAELYQASLALEQEFVVLEETSIIEGSLQNN